jgi:HD superfamily phosphodiesterase
MEKLNQLKNDLVDDMKLIFKDDNKRINHALSVLAYAEKIHSEEPGDTLVVTAASILHDIGIKQAEKKYNSSAPIYQQIEGPPIARNILIKYHLTPDIIDHICDIIADHHSAKNIDTPEFRIVYDADWIVNIPDEFPDPDKSKMDRIINKVFKTNTGRKIALDLYTDHNSKNKRNN